MGKGIKISATDKIWWVFKPDAGSEIEDIVWGGTLQELTMVIRGGDPSNPTIILGGYSEAADASDHGQRLMDEMGT